MVLQKKYCRKVAGAESMRLSPIVRDDGTGPILCSPASFEQDSPLPCP
jgi:hypothetical protein